MLMTEERLMRDFTQKFEKYLSENLGIKPHLIPWEREKGLPYFLRDLYSVYECELLSQPWLVLAAHHEEEATPATLRKHINQVKKKWDNEVLYLAPAMSTYNRKRLIEQKISFVVPGNQMYLPALGLDLREYLRNIRTTKRKKFSPSTQAVLLSMFYDWPKEGVTPSQLAERLDYSLMTMTRAFDEIESAGLADVDMEWRERVLVFDGGKKEVWDRSSALMRSPVNKRIKVMGTRKKNFPYAGESALARYSMLAEPKCPVIAVSNRHWKAMQELAAVMEVPNEEPGATEVEVWSYSPELFARDGMVDPLSLYLSFRESPDERIEMALEKLEEAFPW